LGATLAGALAGAIGGAGLGTLAPAIGVSIDVAPRPIELLVAARSTPVAVVLAPARRGDVPSTGEPEERQP
jgi:hypothetical protein